MNAQEVQADQTGDGSMPCDERHYIRFLTKVIPGPERGKGAYRCEVCGCYFDEEIKLVPLKPENLTERLLLSNILFEVKSIGIFLEAVLS